MSEKLSDVQKLIQLKKDLLKITIAGEEAEGRLARKFERQRVTLEKEVEQLTARTKAIAVAADRAAEANENEIRAIQQRIDASTSLNEKLAAQQIMNEALEEQLANQIEAAKAQAAATDDAAKAAELRKKALDLEDELEKSQEITKELKEQRKVMKDFGGGKFGAFVARLSKINFKELGSQLSPVTGAFDKLFSAAQKTLFEFDSLTQGFERQMQLGQEYQNSIDEQFKSLVQYGTSIEDATEVQKEFATTFTDFTMLAKNQRDIITENALVLAELGVAQADFSQGVQNSTKFFAQSAGQAVIVQRELMETARALGREPGALAEEFAKAGPMLAKFGDEGIKSFKELSRISKITGMELGKILDLTNKFDTFEDAATMTGQLNAALGGNFVNAMDMMMATDPAERFTMVRDAIESAGLSFDEMSYYQKQFYTESLGLGDVGDLALMLSGNMDMLTGSTNKSAAALIEEKQRALEVQSAQEKMQITLQKLVAEGTKFKTQLQAIADLVVKFGENIGTIIPALIKYKFVMVTLTAVTKLNAAANAFNMKGMTRTVFVIGGLATVLFLLAKALMIASPSKVVLAMFGLAAALFAVSKAGPKAAPGIQAVNAPLMQMAVAIFIASTALAGLAIAFSALSLEQMAGMALVLGTIAVSAYFLAPALGALSAGLVALGAAGVTAAPGLLVVGLFIASLAGSIFVAAAGVGLMATGIALMFDSITIEKATAFGALVGALSIGGPFLLMAGAGFAAIGAGMMLFGLALRFIATKDLEAIATFATGLSQIDVSSIEALVDAIRAIADAMNEIPVKKSIAFTQTMTTTAIAARTANTAGARAAMGLTRTTGATSGTIKTEVAGQVEVKFNTALFEKEVINIVQKNKRKIAQIIT